MKDRISWLEPGDEVWLHYESRYSRELDRLVTVDSVKRKYLYIRLTSYGPPEAFDRLTGENRVRSHYRIRTDADKVRTERAEKCNLAIRSALRGMWGRSWTLEEKEQLLKLLVNLGKVPDA
jgi:hypothetical protein